MLLAEDIGPEILRERNASKLIPPLHGALLKNEQDVHLFERLAFLSRREVRLPPPRFWPPTTDSHSNRTRGAARDGGPAQRIRFADKDMRQRKNRGVFRSYRITE